LTDQSDSAANLFSQERFNPNLAKPERHFYPQIPQKTADQIKIDLLSLP